MDLTDALTADQASRVRFFPEIDSTNDAAIALAIDGAPEGTTVIADAQHAGRGRRGRSWFSPPGAGIYVSVVRRPISREEWELVTLAAGVAAARAVTATTGLPVELKWPNDLVTGRPWRKLGGVLCESVGGTNPHGAAGIETIVAIVIGVGINVRATAFPPELADRATSVETELGRAIDRAPLIADFLRQLTAVLDSLRGGDRRAICEAWRQLASSCLGGVVRWQEQGQDRTGVARDIDEYGALIVDTADGRARIVSGEVIWERLPS